jgi:hypothetical protein
MRRLIGLAAMLTILGLSGIPCPAWAQADSTPTGAVANIVSTSADFPIVPEDKDLKSKPQFSQVYQLDNSPIGDRKPLLLVHGGNGEHQKMFRWDKLVEHFQQDPAFMKQFKIYLLRYNSGALLEKTVPETQEAILNLYDAIGKKPLDVLALSMGGNVIQWSLTDPNVDNAVQMVLAMATPFHGSPLFSADWFQYSLYKARFLPGIRLLDSLDYRVYFHMHKNYQKDLKWDNADKAMPQVGAFHSKVPLGPRGNLTHKRDSNHKLAVINSLDKVNKQKFVTYGAYMLNSLVNAEDAHRPISGLRAPIKLLTTQLPAQLGHEQAALKVLNREISAVRVDTDATGDDPHAHFFALNDGITPISSALYLPANALQNHPIIHEQDLPTTAKYVDVKKARVFRGFDHVFFVDGKAPHKTPDEVRDELHPEQGNKHIFDWITDELREMAAIDSVTTTSSGATSSPLSSDQQ